jgi:glucose-6-phosphate 1-dehydrogenase
MVIFGATGDLTKRKLLTALVRLSSLKLLPEHFNVVGFSTRKLKDKEFRTFARDALKTFSKDRGFDEEAAEKLLQDAWFIPSRFDDPDGYGRLSERLDYLDRECGEPCSRIFYMATQPSFFPVIVKKLYESGLSSVKGGAEAGGVEPPKVIVEKPFGRDLDSAKALNDLILSYFDEDQVYRIDHYLGKETVQNILFFRFANGIYEPIWDRRYVDHVEITSAETVGVENRGRYFEEAGILRDMVQNHLLQLLSLVAMEPPTSMDPEVIRAKKVELLNSLRPIGPAEVDGYTVRGQYGQGSVGGEKVRGYREEPDVKADSSVETYVALKVLIDNWRWAGVPFYLRTGKRLNKKVTEIAVHFKVVPHCLFKRTMTGCPDSNVLVLKIQPDEGIAFQFNVKRPGSSNNMEPVTMDFSYRGAFETVLPEAYERLLLDCMLSDSTLFPHKAGIEASWEFITRILEGWEKSPPKGLPNYKAGSWGPTEADELLARDGKLWRNF